MKCIVNKLFIGALFLLGALVCSCQNTTENTVESSVEGKDTLGFKYIDIVHITHTDYGYTDHALIAVDLHKRFIDVALDLALKTKDEIPENRFAWTVEALDPFYSWWNSASEDRRESMLDMIENKQIGINAMPFHIHPYANKEQWDEMFDWIPKDMWSQLDIEVGMQHDVNGFPRAAATRLLDRDIHYIWTGINPHWGGSPVEQPGAFWWKMLMIENFWFGQDILIGKVIFSLRKRSGVYNSGNMPIRKHHGRAMVIFYRLMMYLCMEHMMCV